MMGKYKNVSEEDLMVAISDPVPHFPPAWITVEAGETKEIPDGAAAPHVENGHLEKSTGKCKTEPKPKKPKGKVVYDGKMKLEKKDGKMKLVQVKKKR